MSTTLAQTPDGTAGPATDGASGAAAGRVRFARAVGVALGAALVPYLWVLWDGFSDPLRRHPSGLFSNFFDLQARALVDGHWWVARGSLGIEGFVIDGREYMYFGPFPALLRIPLLPLDLDNDLTAPSMLVAWLVTAMFVALLTWRVRVLMRADAPLTRLETWALGIFVAAVMGGSTLVLLAAIPAVYQEAIAWGVVCTIGALFFLLGVIERATWWGIAGYGALTMAALLSRATVGWACALGGLIAAVWLIVTRKDELWRRWALALAVAAIVPMIVGMSITWAKFGGPFAHPLEEQVYSQTNPERRAFLEANDGALFNLEYVPTSALAYLRPDGFSLSAEYPFVAAPRTPPDIVGDAVFDQTFRTPSLTASMPLLVILAVWGIVIAFRRRPPGRAALARIPIVAAALGAATILVWEGIAPRFMGDALPLLVLASIVATVDIWRRLEGRGRRWRVGVLGLFAGLALIGMVVNVGSGIQLAGLAWNDEELSAYVDAKRSVNDVIGTGLDVEHGTELPGTAPADQLFVVGDCDALYISTGEQYFPRWHPLEYANGSIHRLALTYGGLDQGQIPLIEIGDPVTTTVSVEDRGIAFQRWMRIRVDGTGGSTKSRWIREDPGQTRRITVITDPNLGRVTARFGDETLIDEPIPEADSVEVITRSGTDGVSGPQLTVERRPNPRPILCREIEREAALGRQAGSSSKRNW